MVGALYVSVRTRLPLPIVLKGMLFGLAIWAGSYLGWPPATGVLYPATKIPLDVIS